MKGKAGILLLLAAVFAFVKVDVYAADGEILTGLWRGSQEMSMELFVFPAGMDPQELPLPDTMECMAEGRAVWDTYACPVKWENVPQTDTSRGGRIVIEGTLCPEAGYQISENLGNTVQFEVMLEEEGMKKEPVTIDTSQMETGCLLAVGADLENLPEQLGCAVLRTHVFGEYVTCPVNWDLRGIDTSVPGSYEISGALVLPRCFYLAEESKTLTARVAVTDPNQTDLSGIVSVNETEVVCRWMQPVDPKTVVLEYTMGDGMWAVDPSWKEGAGYYGYVWEQMLVIHVLELGADPHHYFRLREGEEISNQLHIYRDADGVHAESGIFITENGSEEIAIANPGMEEAVRTEENAAQERKENTKEEEAERNQTEQLKGVSEEKERKERREQEKKTEKRQTKNDIEVSEDSEEKEEAKMRKVKQEMQPDKRTKSDTAESKAFERLDIRKETKIPRKQEEAEKSQALHPSKMSKEEKKAKDAKKRKMSEEGKVLKQSTSQEKEKQLKEEAGKTTERAAALLALGAVVGIFSLFANLKKFRLKKIDF